jgi:hypothetical protein
MKVAIAHLLLAVLIVNSVFVPRQSHAQNQSQSDALTSGEKHTKGESYKKLAIIRQHLATAIEDIESKGQLSNATKISLGLAATGLGIMAAGTVSLKLSKSAYDSFVKAGNTGHFGGGVVFGGSMVLGSLYQQAKDLLNRSIRSEFKKNSEDLISLIDRALLSQDLDYQTKQGLLELREKTEASIFHLGRAPWYVKTLNFVEHSISFVGLLSVGASLVSGHPAGIIGASFLMVPVASVTTLLRAVDEAHTIKSQKQALTKSLAYIDHLIKASEIGTVLFTP